MDAFVTSQETVQSALTQIEGSYCVGDVMIAPTAVVSHGVVFRADPGCAITIRDGACIGVGVIVHASSGSIEIHQGACVGGGALILGSGSIGQRVCLGSGATVINPAIAADDIIPAQSLVGDKSRSVDISDSSSSIDDPQPTDTPKKTELNVQTHEEIPDPWIEQPRPDRSRENGTTMNGTRPKKLDVSESSPSKPVYDWNIQKEGAPSETFQVTTSTTIQNQAVIGKQEFEKMLRKMFPDRDAFKQSQIGGK